MELLHLQPHGIAQTQQSFYRLELEAVQQMAYLDDKIQQALEMPV